MQAPGIDTRRHMERAIRELLETYNDLNPAIVDEFSEEPSALEFMRYVARNRPLVVRGGASSWPAQRLWTAEYLKERVKQEVRVAITPQGNADSVLQLGNGTLVFVKPYERCEPFAELLESIQAAERAVRRGNLTESEQSSEPVRYGQSQNDNLGGEYSDLMPDLPRDIPFARIALGRSFDAANFWLGNSLSTTSLHKDNYENIYAQVAGQKHFVLLPPLASPCVAESSLPSYTYTVKLDESSRRINKEHLVATPDEPASSVPVATWDPDNPRARTTPFSHHATPLRVTLHKGDMLYLPAMWYHKVSQSCGPEDFCCAVNYWFDMDFAGPFWATNAFVESVCNPPAEASDD